MELYEKAKRKHLNVFRLLNFFEDDEVLSKILQWSLFDLTKARECQDVRMEELEIYTRIALNSLYDETKNEES